MSQIVSRIVALLVFAWAGLVATVVVAQANDQERFIRVGLPSLAPFGWADFCQRYAGECNGGALQPADIDASHANLALVDRINRFVNLKIQPRSDMEQWRVVDRWDLPSNGIGDCEDFALLKRKLLIEAGLPRQALLITIVFDEKKEGHAVLTVKTSRGDMILDNMNDEMKLWNQTPYRFIKRQSQEDQNIWVAIGAPAATQMVSR
jgi:predicted transglutaminase-like cysteine proteinase